METTLKNIILKECLCCPIFNLTTATPSPPSQFNTVQLKHIFNEFLLWHDCFKLFQIKINAKADD